MSNAEQKGNYLVDVRNAEGVRNAECGLPPSAHTAAI